MADPLSVLAVMGLAFVGRSLSNSGKTSGGTETYMRQPPTAELPSDFKDTRSVPRAELNTDFRVNSEERALSDNQVISPFGDIVKQERSSGQEIMDMKDRFSVDGRMNNLSPVEKQQVGPGLGLAADVPAAGGFQQMFRAMPENVGAYRLTTLPGRIGPAGDTTGGRGQLQASVGYNRPETTAFLPERLPNVPGRAQGQGGALTGEAGRQSHERTKRTTNRAETSTRTDGLNFAPGKHFIGAETLSQDPTRNKSDISDEQYQYNDRVAPGVSSFHGAYVNSSVLGAVGSQVRTPEELMKLGLRYNNRRSSPDRPGNAGRMNVRAGPLNQSGALTAVRSDNTKYDGRVNPVSAGWTQQYVLPEHQNLNPYKGQPNTRLDLGIAKRQLANNPLAHNLSD